MQDGLMTTSFDSRKLSQIHQELHAHLPPEPALRTKALESLLTEKKLLDADAIDAWIELYRDEIGPKRGAKVVARAWTDPAYKERLLTDATAAIDELFCWPCDRPSPGGREYDGGAQSRRLHALLLLPGFAARHVANMVQIQRVQSPSRPRSARRSGGVRRRA